MAVGIFMLSTAKACRYLGCSALELAKWIPPDRVLPFDGSDRATRGMRLWSGAALDAAKPHVEAWRERDRVADELHRRELEAQCAATKQRRKGMVNGGAARC